MQKISAGILMYRVKNGKPEILLVHPGGPYWVKKEYKTWSIPKGEAKEGEELLDVAKREFKEETGFDATGELQYFREVKSSSGKIVKAWITKGDLDAKKIKGMMIDLEFPPKSGKMIKVPEIDRGDFFQIPEAKKRAVPYQVGLIEQFEKTFKK